MTHQHLELPSLDRLQDLFQPRFMRGELVWKVSRGKAKPGKLAGNLGTKGYVKVQIEGVSYAAHRIIYKMYHGVDPGDKEVDHIDLDRGDDRVDNLRLATRAENSQNTPGSRKGLKGAYLSLRPVAKPWMATICKNNVRRYLGSFYTEEEAHEAYVKASAAHHGEFGRTHRGEYGWR